MTKKLLLTGFDKASINILLKHIEREKALTGLCKDKERDGPKTKPTQHHQRRSSKPVRTRVHTSLQTVSILIPVKSFNHKTLPQYMKFRDQIKPLET